MKKFKISLFIKKLLGIITAIVMLFLLGVYSYIYLTASQLVILEKSKATWVVLGSNAWIALPLLLITYYLLAALLVWCLDSLNLFKITGRAFKNLGRGIISWGYE